MKSIATLSPDEALERAMHDLLDELDVSLASVRLVFEVSGLVHAAEDLQDSAEDIAVAFREPRAALAAAQVAKLFARTRG